MAQKEVPSDLYFKKIQVLGNWQHFPQFRHFPFLFLETGSTEVKVRRNFTR